MGAHQRHQETLTMAVTTKCPKCETVFRVSAQQLGAAGGWVRCGRCTTEFNALSQLTDSRKDRAAAVALDSGPKPEAELKTLVATGERPVGHGLREGAWKTILWTIGVLLLSALLAGQYLWQARDELARDPELRPRMLSFCEIAGCEIRPYRKLDDITLRKRDLRMDPDRPDVLVVNAILVNRAPIEQAFPLLELQLKNEDGRVVASRRFEAGEYVGSSARGSTGMVPETPYHVYLEVVVDDDSAVNFGFQFL